MPTVLILTGTTSFPDPGNWNPTANRIEVLGAGGQGFRPDSGNRVGSAGGGGGGYGYGTNLSPVFPVIVRVSSSGAGNVPSQSYFDTGGASYVFADDGLTIGSTNNAGGAGGQNFGPFGFAGGNGSSGGINGAVGSGGGGAAGPNGRGGNAGSGTTNYYGGAADGGVLAGPTTGQTNGNSGFQWDPSHGVGAGGSGGSTTTLKNPGAGGQYGGGSGGCYFSGTAAAQAPGPGLIVLSWLPPTPSFVGTRVILLNGASSFPDPGNWNPAANKVECVGAGGFGVRQWTLPPLARDEPTQLAIGAGGGGGGGGYGYDTNLNPTFPVSVYVMYSVNVPTNSNTYRTNWFNNTNVPGAVYAGMGTNGTGGISGGNGYGGDFYPNGFRGGNSFVPNVGGPGGGGGGAGGPSGAGTDAWGWPGAGGDGGTIPGQPISGEAGWTGIQWDPSHGTGGGGGGGATASLVNGGVGSQYGGGGGGCYYPGGTTNQSGGDGLMIITYVPTPLPAGFTMISV